VIKIPAGAGLSGLATGHMLTVAQTGDIDLTRHYRNVFKWGPDPQGPLRPTL